MILKFYFSFLLFFFARILFAQNISVASFKLDEMDQTANLQGTTVIDQNGEKCALIKVITTQTGFSFDVGMLGISKTVQKNGEIWVYVPMGVRKMTISHSTLGQLRDYPLPITTAKAKTYVMQLTTEQVETVVHKAITAQYVLFHVYPSNSIVELDGQTLETTKGTASKRMPFGSYSYRVQAPLYAPEAGIVRVNDTKNKHVVNVRLKPQFASVNFIVPNNAEIWINDENKGIGTCSLELGYGSYKVECKKANHRSSQQEINICPTTNNTIQLKAPTPIYGSLDINSTPGDAEILLDDNKIGTTPMFIEQCLIGTHTLKLSKQGYKDYTTTFNITEGQTASITTPMKEGFSTEVLTFTVNGVNFEMVPVEGGSFQMGATREQGDYLKKSNSEPVHNVTLSNYAIGKFEVTQKLWKAVMGENLLHYLYDKGDNFPVYYIRWEQCQEFINRLNLLTGQKFRLPTEAEWEYACRGGKYSKGFKYSGSNDLEDVACYLYNSYDSFNPVGTKAPNELGIYDMSGNVNEWCNDFYSPYKNEAQTNPTGPQKGKGYVVRGGSRKENDFYGEFLSSYRECKKSSYKKKDSYLYSYTGFRLAISL